MDMASTAIEKRTLMNLPHEILLSILELAVGRVSIESLDRDNKRWPLTWKPKWVPNLILVSKYFGSVARSVIAEGAWLTYTDSYFGELGEPDHPHEHADRIAAVARFPTYLLDKAPQLRIVPHQVITWKPTDQLDIGKFKSVKRVEMVLGSIENFTPHTILDPWLDSLQGSDNDGERAANLAQVQAMLDIFLSVPMLTNDERGLMEHQLDQSRNRWASAPHETLDRLKAASYAIFRSAMLTIFKKGGDAAGSLFAKIATNYLRLTRNSFIGLRDETLVTLSFVTDLVRQEDERTVCLAPITLLSTFCKHN